jgi:hypothetical protein
MEKMKRDCIEFPKHSMTISTQLKQIIVSMTRFHEADRINWEDLFASPLFSANLLIEVGLNVFNF